VDAIRREHGDAIQVEVLRGSGGVFDVVIDGEKVFSKWDQNRFPKNQEILDLIAQRTAK